MRIRPLVFLGMALAFCSPTQLDSLPANALNAQDASTTQSGPANNVDFRSELEQVARICDQVDLAEQAQLTRNWVPNNRADRQVLYLPVKEPTLATAVERQWYQRFRQVREGFASTLLDEAKQVVSEDEATAYRKLWQAYRESPSNLEIAKVLGALARAPTAQPKTARSKEFLSELGWPAGSYLQINAPHFTILSQADPRTTREVALQLEQFYVLWTQFFYELWAPPNLLAQRLAGDNSATWPRHERMRVVLMKDRSQYVEVLGVGEQNIGRSVGYYNPGARMSFFYPAEDLEDTFQHELTHQLLMEATRIAPQQSVASTGGIWLLEGIALYFESLDDKEYYWTLGGFEASRIQTARYRALRDGMWPSWKSFATADAQTWKSDASIARQYSHSVGLTHVLLDKLGPRGKQETFRQLVGIYQGQNHSEQLLDLLAADEKAAQKSYQDWMIVENRDLAMLDNLSDLEELVLTASTLDAESWQQLQRCVQLTWLDLSFGNVTDRDLEWLGKETKEGVAGASLERLSLEGTTVTAQALARVVKLPKLKELDLSSCKAMDDAALELLRNHPTLEILWLSNTPATDATLAVLKSIPNLRQFDASGSQIDRNRLQEFLNSMPLQPR